MFCIRPGWRWTEGRMKFNMIWRREEQRRGMTGLQKTMEVLSGMMIDELCVRLAKIHYGVCR